MNPISLVHLHKILLSSPRSHWSATGPSSKTQPTTTSHTCSGNTHDKAVGTPNRSGQFLRPVRLLLLDLASHRQGKTVRPVWQTGQAGFVQKTPQNTSDTQNTSRAYPPLSKRSHSTQRLCCPKTLHDSPQD
jgi:hypothetical protein